MEELQYSLDGYVFGANTSVLVAGVEFGEAETSQTRKPKPRSDGINFGRMYRRSRQITFDLTIDNFDDSDAHDLLDELQAQWSGDDIRLDPGAVVPLSWRRGGRERRVWGRPNHCTPVTGAVSRGLVPVTATFDTVNQYYYSNQQQSIHTNLVPPSGSVGYTVPYTMPLTMSGESIAQGGMSIGGSAKTPITIQFHGPVINPSVQITHANGSEIYVKMIAELASDNWVYIDPFFGTVTTRFGSNWAGKFTADSTPLFDIALKPGDATAVMRGNDSTGTAEMTLYWYNAFHSF